MHDVTLSDLPVLPRPNNVLMTTPAHFEVAYVINPHMAENIGSVNPHVAHAQWNALYNTYRHLGFNVHTLDGQPALPDMVFCANQTLPFILPDGREGVVLSHMHAPERKAEVDHYQAFFSDAGYLTHALPTDTGDFEGMGDALWHPGRRLLWGGYGFRTDSSTYTYLSDVLEVPILMLELHDPDFYHLDTCLCLLDEQTALICREAFTDEGLALINRMFDRILVAPEDEARTLFSCNAHSPDGTHVLIQSGCTETVQQLENAGYTVLEHETNEFLKAGGSVFCMKLMYW